MRGGGGILYGLEAITAPPSRKRGVSRPLFHTAISRAPPMVASALMSLRGPRNTYSNR